MSKYALDKTNKYFNYAKGKMRNVQYAKFWIFKKCYLMTNLTSLSGWLIVWLRTFLLIIFALDVPGKMSGKDCLKFLWILAWVLEALCRSCHFLSLEGGNRFSVKIESRLKCSSDETKSQIEMELAFQFFYLRRRLWSQFIGFGA